MYTDFFLCGCSHVIIMQMSYIFYYSSMYYYRTNIRIEEELNLCNIEHAYGYKSVVDIIYMHLLVDRFMN